MLPYLSLSDRMPIDSNWQLPLEIWSLLLANWLGTDGQFRKTKDLVIAVSVSSIGILRY